MTTRKDKIDALQKRLEQLKAQERKAQARAAAAASAAARKQDTRRKILAGAVVAEAIAAGELAQEQCRRWLNAYLVRDDDRALFGLPPAPKHGHDQRPT